MNYSIVFSSKTGNTKILARKIREALGAEGCTYFGEPSEKGAEEEIIFIGFWTDKGTCDEALKEFLVSLDNKKVYIFGTAGFGGSEEYFKQILQRVKMNLNATNTILGEFMCQGKMPRSVGERYEKMAKENPDNKKFKEMIDNYNKALVHPNDEDLEKVIENIKNVICIYK